MIMKIGFLTKTMRQALKYFEDNNPNLQGQFFDTLKIPIARETVEQLVDDGFIRWADTAKTAVFVTEKGKHYKEIVWQSFLMWFLERLVIFGFGLLSGYLLSRM